MTKPGSPPWLTWRGPSWPDRPCPSQGHPGRELPGSGTKSGRGPPCEGRCLADREPGFRCWPGVRRLELQDCTRSEPNQGRARPMMAGPCAVAGAFKGNGAGFVLRPTGFLDRRRRRACSAGGMINSPRDPAADGTGSCRVWRRTEQAVLKPLSHSRPVASGSMFVPGALTRNHGSESAPCLQRAQTCVCCLQMEGSNPNKESLMCYRGMLCKQPVCDVPCLRRTQTRLRCQIQGLIGSSLPHGPTRQPRMRRLYRGWSGQGPASR